MLTLSTFITIYILLCPFFFFFLVLEFFEFFSAKARPTLHTNGTFESCDLAALECSKNADSTSEMLHLSHKMQTAALHSPHPFTPLSQPPPAPSLPWLPCLAYALG